MLLEVITTKRFSKSEILAVLQASTKVISIHKSLGDRSGFVVNYWRGADDIMCAYDSTTFTFGRDPPSVQYTRSLSSRCLKKNELARYLTGDDLVLIDIRCIFLMFKQRLTDNHISHPVESARVQTVKFLDRFREFSQYRGDIWLIYAYLSSCITALGLKPTIRIKYISQEITPQLAAEIQQQSDVYYDMVMDAIGKLT